MLLTSPKRLLRIACLLVWAARCGESYNLAWLPLRHGPKQSKYVIEVCDFAIQASDLRAAVEIFRDMQRQDQKPGIISWCYLISSLYKDRRKGLKNWRLPINCGQSCSISLMFEGTRMAHTLQQVLPFLIAARKLRRIGFLLLHIPQIDL